MDQVEDPRSLELSPREAVQLYASLGDTLRILRYRAAVAQRKENFRGVATSEGRITILEQIQERVKKLAIG